MISYDKVDELRSMMSMHRVGKRLVPRPWVINPWTSKRINFPQPIAPRCGVAGWTHLVKSMQQKWGLRMDEAGVGLGMQSRVSVSRYVWVTYRILI